MSAKKDKSDKADAASSNGNPSTSQAKPECFVIMPMGDPEGYEPGHSGRVFDDLFTTACERAGYRAVRADQVRQTNLIHLDVLQKIIESPMALCDLSNRNPNVMFELGLRQAFDKPVVLVQEYGTPPIFDITPLRYTEYHREMLYRQVIEDQEKITTAILATKEAVKNTKSVNSIVKLLSLTRAASLSSISEEDKESGLFQVVMTELSNIKSELARTRKPIKKRHDDLGEGASTSEQEISGETMIEIIALNVKSLEAGVENLQPYNSIEIQWLNSLFALTYEQILTYEQMRRTPRSIMPMSQYQRFSDLVMRYNAVKEKYESLVDRQINLKE